MRRKILMTAILAYLLNGCQLFDPAWEDGEATQEATQELQQGSFEDENVSKRAVVTASCKYNETVAFRYFATPQDAHEEYWDKTKGLESNPGSGKALKPFWDLRYVNSGELLVKNEKRLDLANHAIYTGLDARVGQKNIEAGVEIADSFVDASVVQAKCIDGVLAAGTTLNLLDSDTHEVRYGGPHSTFMYRIADSKVITPWNSKGEGNLMIQGYFDKPIYTKYSKNIGGGVNIGLFLQNRKTGVEINYIIGLYAIGKGWIEEQRDIKYDPTTHIVHVSTVVDNGTLWSTKSPKSKSIQRVKSSSSKSRGNTHDWRDFYRVNISYQNLLNVLKELQKNPPEEVAGEDFGVNPADWKVNSIYVQYELEEDGGDALLAGSFKGFEVYTTKLPR